MTKWEYKQHTSDWDLTEREFIEWLNENGKDGWEMVEYSKWESDYWDRCKYTCLFKRKIED